MDCESVKQELYVYLDREQLTVLRRRQITRHLDRCRNCADLKEFQVMWRSVVATRSQDPVPDALRHRIDDLLSSAIDDDPSAG